MNNVLLQLISPHVFWLPPAPPDRPSLCAVVGSRRVLMLDAGASDTHTGESLQMLAGRGIGSPFACVLTHWHWDHVFGADVVQRAGAAVFAHERTAGRLDTLRGWAWDDAALDARVASGEEIAFCADNIKLELAEPRAITIALPDVVFSGSLTFDLGGVTAQVQHVGGDHADDSCVVYVPENRVLFLGDCLYDAIYAPARHYTRKVFPLLDTVLAYDAEQFIEGHSDTILTRADVQTMADKLRRAWALIEQHGGDEGAIFAAAGHYAQDEDFAYFARALIAGIPRT